MKTVTTEITAWTDAKLLRSAVRRLNDQHVRTSAGFYGLGSRFFRARSVKGVLAVYDFDTWTPVSEEQAIAERIFNKSQGL